MERTKRHLPAAALSVLLSLTLAFCMIPAPAFATEGEQESGSAEADTTAVDNAESDIAGNETEGQQNAADDELGEGVIAGEQNDAADDEPVAGEADNGDEGESSQPEEQKTQVPVPQGKELIFNGEWQPGIDPAEGWTFACTDGAEGHFSAESGCMRMDAGDYSCTLRLKEGFTWDDGTIDDKTVAWSIKPKPIAAPVVTENLMESSEPQRGVADGEGYELSGDFEATEAGDYSATATLLPNYIWDDGTTEPKQIGWKITKGDEELNSSGYWDDYYEDRYIGYCDINLSYSTCTYNGKRRTPTVEVSDDYYDYDTWLWEDEDYTVEYRNNVDVGTATVIIRGTGYYYGTIKKTFKIVPRDISTTTVTLSKTQYIANGAAHKPTARVSLNGKNLKLNEDFTVSYSDNRKAGEAAVTITGKGNFTGTTKAFFIIAPTSQGWFKSGSNWFYKTKTGLASGWKKIGGTWYYFNKNTKRMQTGWKTIDGKKYHFTKNGAMESSCWKSNGKNWFYLTSSGAAKSGWLNSGGTWYYLDPSTKHMQTGLKIIDGKRYYFRPNGSMISNEWKSIDGRWSYFTNSGAAKRGWLKWGNDWYWFDSNGKAVEGGAYRTGNTYNYFYYDGTWAISLKNGKKKWSRIVITYTYPSGRTCSCEDYWYYIDSKGRLAGLDGDKYYYWNGYWYSFDSQGRAYERYNDKTEKIEEWSHDDYCYLHDKCDGGFWEDTGRYAGPGH